MSVYLFFKYVLKCAESHRPNLCSGVVRKQSPMKTVSPQKDATRNPRVKNILATFFKAELASFSTGLRWNSPHPAVMLTQQQQLQLPAGVLLVSAQLLLDGVVDPLGLPVLRGHAASRHRTHRPDSLQKRQNDSQSLLLKRKTLAVFGGEKKRRGGKRFKVSASSIEMRSLFWSSQNWKKLPPTGSLCDRSLYDPSGQ